MKNCKNGRRQSLSKSKEPGVGKAVNELVSGYVHHVSQSQGLPLRELLLAIEKKIIASVLLLSAMNEKKSSGLLGLKPTTLCEKMKRFGIHCRDRGEYAQMPAAKKDSSLL